MTLRVAAPLLPQPGERMDAIAAVEIQLQRTPDDPTAWDMKRELYAALTEREYWSLVTPDVIDNGNVHAPSTPSGGNASGTIRIASSGG